MEFLNNISTIQTLQPNMLRPMQQLPTLQKLPTIKSITPTPKSVGVTSMPKDTKEYWYSSSDPTQVNSLLDVISNTLDPIDNHGDITNAFSDNMLEWWRRHFSKPIEYHDWGMFFNNTLRGFGEDVDVLANPIKALLPVEWTTAKESDKYSTAGQRFKKAIGFGVKGRYNYDADTGNGLLNLAVETLADPLNIIEMGVGGVLKSASKKSLSIGSSLVEDAVKNSNSVLSKELLSKVPLDKLYKNKDITEAWLKGDADTFANKFYNYFISNLDDGAVSKYALETVEGIESITQLGRTVYKKTGTIATHSINIDLMRTLYKVDAAVESIDKGILIVAGTPFFPAVHVYKELRKANILEPAVTKYVTANILRNAEDLMGSSEGIGLGFKLDSYAEALEKANKVIDDIALSGKITQAEVVAYRKILPEQYAASMASQFKAIYKIINKIADGSYTADEGIIALQTYFLDNAVTKEMTENVTTPGALAEYWRRVVTNNEALHDYLDFNNMQRAIDKWQEILDNQIYLNSVTEIAKDFEDGIKLLKETYKDNFLDNIISKSASIIKDADDMVSSGKAGRNSLFYAVFNDMLQAIGDTHTFYEGHTATILNKDTIKNALEQFDYFEELLIDYYTGINALSETYHIHSSKIYNPSEFIHTLVANLKNKYTTMCETMIYAYNHGDFKYTKIQNNIENIRHIKKHFKKEMRATLINDESDLIKNEARQIAMKNLIADEIEKIINVMDNDSYAAIRDTYQDFIEAAEGLEKWIDEAKDYKETILNTLKISYATSGIMSDDDKVVNKSMEIIKAFIDGNVMKHVNYKDAVDKLDYEDLRTSFSEFSDEDIAYIFDDCPNLVTFLLNKPTVDTLSITDDILEEIDNIRSNIVDYENKMYTAKGRYNYVLEGPKDLETPVRISAEEISSHKYTTKWYEEQGTIKYKDYIDGVEVKRNNIENEHLPREGLDINDFRNTTRTVQRSGWYKDADGTRKFFSGETKIDTKSKSFDLERILNDAYVSITKAGDTYKAFQNDYQTWVSIQMNAYERRRKFLNSTLSRLLRDISPKHFKTTNTASASLNRIKKMLIAKSDNSDIAYISDLFEDLSKYGDTIEYEMSLNARAAQLLSDSNVFNAFMETMMNFEKNPADMIISEQYVKNFIDSMNINMYARFRNKSLALDNLVRGKYVGKQEEFKKLLQKHYGLSYKDASSLSTRILEMGHVDSGSDTYATELAILLESESWYNALLNNQKSTGRHYIIYDIETFDPASKDMASNAKYGSIHQITIKRFNDGEPITFTTEDPEIIKQRFIDRGLPEPTVIKCENEADLLLKFDSKLSEENPLGLIGYNTHSFDQGFIRERWRAINDGQGSLDTFDRLCGGLLNPSIASTNIDVLPVLKRMYGIPVVSENDAKKIYTLLEDRAKAYASDLTSLKLSDIKETIDDLTENINKYIDSLSNESAIAINELSEETGLSEAELKLKSKLSEDECVQLKAFSEHLSKTFSDAKSDMNILSNISHDYNGDGDYILPNFFTDVNLDFKQRNANGLYYPEFDTYKLRSTNKRAVGEDVMSEIALQKYYNAAFAPGSAFAKAHPEIQSYKDWYRWLQGDVDKDIVSLQDLLNAGSNSSRVGYRYFYNKQNIERFFEVDPKMDLPKKAAKRLTDVSKSMSDKLDRLLRDPEKLFSESSVESYGTKYFKNFDDLKNTTTNLIKAISSMYPEHWVTNLNLNKILSSPAETFVLFWQIISEHGEGLYANVPKIIREALWYMPNFNESLKTLKPFEGSNLFKASSLYVKRSPITFDEYLSLSYSDRLLTLNSSINSLSDAAFDEMKDTLASYMFRSEISKTTTSYANKVSFGADAFSSELWKTVSAGERMDRFSAMLNVIPNANADMILRRNILNNLSIIAKKFSNMSGYTQRRYVTNLNRTYAKSVDLLKLSQLAEFVRDPKQMVGYMLYNNAPFINLSTTKYSINNNDNTTYTQLIKTLKKQAKLLESEYGIELIDTPNRIQFRFKKDSKAPVIKYNPDADTYIVGDTVFNKDELIIHKISNMDHLDNRSEFFLNGINDDINNLNSMLSKISDSSAFLGSSKIVSYDTFGNIKEAFGPLYNDKDWWSVDDLKNMGFFRKTQFATYDFSIDDYVLYGYHNYGSSLEDITRSYKTTINCMDAKTLCVSSFFSDTTGVDLSNNIGSFFYGLSDKEIVDVLNADNAPIVAVLVKDNSKQGYHLESLNILNEKDLARARNVNARIMPYQVYSRMFTEINNNADALSSGFLNNNFIKSILFAYKIGYLMSPGTWLRNVIDSNLKATIDTKDPVGMVKNTWTADKLLRQYDTTINIMKEANLSSGAFLTNTDIEAFFEDSKYKALRNKCPLDKDTFYEINGFVKYGPSAGETRALSDWMKADKKLSEQLSMTPTNTTYDKLVDLGSRAMTPMSYIESRVRFAQYLTLMEQGVTKSDAFKRISHTAFDYSIKSKTTHFIENIIPFYNFQKLNILYWYEELSAKPFYAKMIDDFIGDVLDSYDLEPSEVAKNRGVQYYMYNGDPMIDSETGMVLKLNPSYMDFVNFMTNPVNKVLNSTLAPIQAIGHLAEGKLLAGTSIADTSEAADYAELTLKDVMNPQYAPLIGPIVQRFFASDDPNTIANEDSTAKKNYKRLSKKPVEAVIGAMLPSLFGSVTRWEKYKQNTKYYDTHGYYNSNSFRTYTRPARNYNYYTPNRRYPGYRIKHSRAYWYAIRVMNAPARYRYQVTYY